MTQKHPLHPDRMSDQTPHDPRRSQAQITGLVKRFGNKPRRVLDLGCGAGRVLIPLTKAGHDLTGVDRDQRLLRACNAALKEKRLHADLIRADFLESIPARGRFDAMLVLGNTLMTIVDVGQAVSFLRRASAKLKPSGELLIDDFPFEFWNELTSGNWQSGVSDDGRLQMVWAAGDSVFALRRGRNVDRRSWTIKRSDDRFRLWSMGELTLAARLAGLSAPSHDAQSGLIALSRGVRRRNA